MSELFVPNKLKEKVKDWRDNQYQCGYSTIQEIFDYSFISNDEGLKALRYLRLAQIEALEIYWYLRLVENTPKIYDLYGKLYDKPEEKFKALGINLSEEILKELVFSGKGLESIIDRIKTDDKFVKTNKLNAVRETLSLNYPSYILALAMGAGKTVLIGSIIATEFAMALEHGDEFVKNALVFAPGKTILGALKELSDVPYNKILPPRLYKQFITSVKFTYTQDGQKDIPIIEGSSYNIIVTNTEKIRIQKPTSKAKPTAIQFKQREKEEEKTDEANQRLLKISSLPNLAVFSDEAHHTYGQSLEKDLKKVRKTVDYLAENTSVIAVVNTTGTPYYKKQLLRDVVYWYGLSQGIEHGILKEVGDNIISYDNVTDKEFLEDIIRDFFTDYKDVTLPDNSKAKLAIYFPQTSDVKKARPMIEKKLIELGIDPSVVFEVNNKSDEQTKDYFNNRKNEITNPYRVYLLVNMGTEGWNVPSLFATALARKLKTSNNFVLQAATRCLRQVPGNKHKAKIYLSEDNIKVLDKQLQETYNESLEHMVTKKSDTIDDIIVLRKTDMPKVLIKKQVPRVVKKDKTDRDIKFTLPKTSPKTATKKTYDLKDSHVVKEVLSEKNEYKVNVGEELDDVYTVANNLANVYRIDVDKLLPLLSELYPEGDVPIEHIDNLKEQLEEQQSDYEIIYEEIEQALAIVKSEGFTKEVVDGETVYCAEIVYHKSKAENIFSYESAEGLTSRELSFHYTPYNMDSQPEKDFLIKLLNKLDEDTDNVEAVYFTGAITDAKKTDIIFEYKDVHGAWRNYTPDFLIIKKDGKIIIVEVKGEPYKNEQKEKAIKQIADINKERIKYHIVSTQNDKVDYTDFNKVKKSVYGEE